MKRSFSKISPLRDVVVCITGLPSSQKTKLHNLVERLGGRFTGDLIVENTTHLIAEVAEGAKHHEAFRSKHIIIVKPSWLEECYEKRTRLLETPHLLHPITKTDKALATLDFDSNEKVESIDDENDYDLDRNSVKKACDKVLTTTPFNSLFADCSFFFVGFKNDEDDDVNRDTDIDKDTNADIYTSHTLQWNDLEYRDTFAKLVRHGMGTRYWELPVDVTHVIVSEYCDSRTLSAANYIGEHHPNHPAILSPQWIIQSLIHQSHQSYSKYSARRIEPPKPKLNLQQTPSFRSSKIPKTKSKSKTKLKSSMIFQGMIFCIIPCSSSENYFNTSVSVLEDKICSNGGVMISKRIVEALLKDAKKQKNQPSSLFQQRVVCVVFMGRMVPNFTNRNAWLTIIEQQNCCPLIPVNPNYIQCCINEELEFSPDLHPILFQPQLYPLRRLPLHFFDSSSKQASKIVAAVSGFVGIERFGIMQMIKHMGAEYTENLTKSNTHLICKKAEGPKYERGLIWSIHVLSVDWLYHILKYGYGGATEGRQKGNNENSDISGCEKNFYFAMDDDKLATKLDSKHANDSASLKKSSAVDPLSFEKEENKSETTPVEGKTSPTTMFQNLHRPLSLELDKQIQSALQKLQTPIEETNNNLNNMNAINRVVHRDRKRRPRSFPVKVTKKVIREPGSSEDEEDMSNANDFEVEEHIKTNAKGDEEFQDENEDGLLGSLVESQAVWYAPHLG